jgi:hypothetical protein
MRSPVLLAEDAESHVGESLTETGFSLPQAARMYPLQ